MRLILAVATCLVTQSACFGQIFIEQVSPPVLQRGQTTRVTLHGTDLHQGVDLWTSLPAGLVEAKPVGDASQAVFDVRVSPTAPLGMHGLRAATRGGLSNVHLFQIDDLPITILPTALSPATPQANAAQLLAAPVAVKLPACVIGSCRPAAVDRFEIEAAAGEVITFEVVGNRFGKDYDPLVRICTPAGQLLVERDNDPGLYFDCRFSHQFQAAGKYIVELRDARYAGNPGWYYALRMGHFPEARVAVPAALRPGQDVALTFPQTPGFTQTVKLPADFRSALAQVEVRRPGDQTASWLTVLNSAIETGLEVEPNGTFETATVLKAPCVLSGVLGAAKDEDWFAFELQAGQQFEVRGYSKQLGSPADLELLLYGPEKNEMSRIDDNGTDEASFVFNVGKTGQHRLLVRDLSRHGGPAFAYAVELVVSQPRIKVAADVSAITLPQKNYQPVPLKITRTNFNGPIELALVGAPAGVTLESTTIPEAAVEHVCRLSATEAVPQGVSTFQIVAKGTVAPPKPADPAKPADPPYTIETLVRTQPMIDRQLRNVDLILYALREDQTNLPPELTDRFALMVAPPAPFALEMPELVLTLPRFQTATLPLTTTRAAGFTSPITFRAEGGQIGSEKEERNQVYLQCPAATPTELTVNGTFRNRILTGLAKHRVDLFATAEHEGHAVTLIRTFTLDVKSAFAPVIEPAAPMTEPGTNVKLTITANRLSTFDGPITITPYAQTTFKLPATIEIPVGKPTVEFEVPVPKETPPNRYQIRFTAASFVGKYEESLDPAAITIEVKKPPEPKK